MYEDPAWHEERDEEPCVWVVDRYVRESELEFGNVDYEVPVEEAEEPAPF